MMDETVWMDEEAYIMADVASSAPTPTAQPSTASDVPAEKHGAAMELAPSKEPIERIQDEPPVADIASEIDPGAESPSQPMVDENVRVRVLETMPEPIMDASGDPLTLEAGDVHFLDEGTATWLVDAGVAERAEL